MTVNELLTHLDAVRRTSRGYLARCPAHADRSPSLSIAEGKRGVLLRCWAACSLDAICDALHITKRELFYGQATDPTTVRAAQRQRERKRAKERAQHVALGATADALRAAETFIASRRGLDISNFSDAQLDGELQALAECYALLDSERTHE